MFVVTALPPDYVNDAPGSLETVRKIKRKAGSLMTSNDSKKLISEQSSTGRCEDLYADFQCLSIFTIETE